MWSRGEIRPPLEASYAPGEAEMNRQAVLPPSPLFPGKELLGSRHHSTFSPPVASVCTPKYKRKIREAVPFVTPVTGVPRTPSIWTQMTARQNQQLSSSSYVKQKTVLNQPAESARSASHVTKVHMQAMRRGSGDPRRVEDPHLMFPDDEEPRSPDRLPAGMCASVVRGADLLTPTLPMKTPHPVGSATSTAGRLHRRASTGLKGAIELSISSRDHDSSVDVATPSRPEPASTAFVDLATTPLSDLAPEDASEQYRAALLEAEALIDAQLSGGEISETLKKELDIPTELPRFLHPIQGHTQVGAEVSSTLTFTEFATLFLTANGMPLLQRKLPDGTHKISLYTGDSRKMFEEREKEFNASFDRSRGEATAFSRAALWFSRNTMCQRCDTQLTSCFAKYGEIPIQTQLLNHMKGGVKRRDAVANCYKSLDNLHQKCDQSKYDEKRRIQNLMRRLAENIIVVFVSAILPNYDHPDLEEIKTCFEELYFDEESLMWSITMSFEYSGIIYGCFWDWMELHELLPSGSEIAQIDVVRAALQTLKVVPSELSETDLNEVLQCIALTTSDRQLAAFSSSVSNSMTRDQFVKSLSRVPFNHPDFQLMDSERAPSSVNMGGVDQPPLIESQPPIELIEDFMQELLEVADLITKTILNDICHDPSELELVKRRVSKTYNSPGTATQCQQKLNIRSSDFVTQDFLASFIVSYEEIQIMLAADHLPSKPIILCRPNFPSIRVINLAMQLMITCVTLAMTPSERYALRNPMGPLAVNVDEVALVERARSIRIPLPPENEISRRSCAQSAGGGGGLSERISDPQAAVYSALKLPKNYRIVVESLEESDARLQRQRAESLARLVDGPKLRQAAGELTALSWGTRPELEFEVQSDEDLSDQQLAQAQILPDTIANLQTTDAKKAFVILNSAECLIETARILLSGIKSFPVPAVQLDDPLLREQDQEKWKDFWEQHSKLAERVNVSSGCLRWTSLLLILNVFDQIRPFIFS